MRVERIVGSSLNMRVDRITLEHLLCTTARVSDLTPSHGLRVFSSFH